MKAPIERIRVSQRSRDILITMKRRTGIEHWNVLCRWAFFASLANPNKPVPAPPSQESNIEMNWDVFAGDLGDNILSTFATRAAKDKVQATKAELAAYFRNHIERGILQLQAAKDLTDLIKKCIAIDPG